MRSRAPLAVFACVVTLTTGGPSRAQGAATPAPKAAAGTEGDDAHQRALKHFERGRELYREGSYKEALAELEAAQRLDPEAKDLVYNLAVVSEKLSKIDEALRWMRRYANMDLDEAERGRADSAIRRLEGAKKSLVGAPRDDTRKGETPAPPKMGRLDTWTFVAGGAAVAGLAVGSIFGVDALASRPKSGFVTGRDGSYSDLAAKADDAHGKAIVADVGFGVFVVGGVACALLYFLRPKEAAPAKGAVVPVASLRAAPGGFAW